MLPGQPPYTPSQQAQLAQLVDDAAAGDPGEAAEPNPTLPLPVVALVGEDGNAFAILGRWQAAARDAGWPAERISAVLAEARAGDYDHLLAVIVANSEAP